MSDCGVCEKITAKYKCPKCKLPYCSANCCKTHKAEGCNPVLPEPTVIESTKPDIVYNYPTEDTVPVEKLKVLCESDDLKKCLQNPHVRDIMRAILNSRDPTEAIAQAMTEPIFVEMADACLEVVEPPDVEEPC